MQPFHEMLIQARRAKGMTQSQLAESLGVTRQAISNWENGKVVPDATRVSTLAQVLGDDRLLLRDTEGPVSQAEPVAAQPHRPGRHWGRYALAFAAGAAAMLLVIYFVVPFILRVTAKPATPPAAVVAARAPVFDEPLSWYQTPDERIPGQPFIVIDGSDEIIKVSHDTSFPEEYIWKVHPRFSEMNDIPFTVTALQIALFRSENEAVSYQLFTTEEELDTCFHGRAIRASSGGVGFGVIYPVSDAVAVGIAVKGVDDHGVERVFRRAMPLSQEIDEQLKAEDYQKTTPLQAGMGYLTLTTLENPAPYVKDDSFTRGGCWYFTFTIENTGDQTMTLQTVEDAFCAANGIVDVIRLTGEKITDVFGSNVLKPGESFVYNGMKPKQPMDELGEGFRVHATDEAGNEQQFTAFIDFAPEETAQS